MTNTGPGGGLESNPTAFVTPCFEMCDGSRFGENQEKCPRSSDKYKHIHFFGQSKTELECIDRVSHLTHRTRKTVCQRKAGHDLDFSRKLGHHPVRGMQGLVPRFQIA